jgi:trans-2-enoyl-CoA reductase
MIPSSTRAVRLHAHDSTPVVEELAVRPPGPGEVLVRMQLAPINPADLNVIQGTYGRLPTLPAILGNEGLGAVAVMGSGVDLAAGTLVRPLDGLGTWAQWITVPADRLLSIPTGLDPTQAAQLTVNPGTAWGVLDAFGPFSPGTTIAVNAARAAVGRSLIALGASRGLRVLALVRDASCTDELLALGATAVVAEGREAAKALRAHGPIVLALNQVGGDSGATLAKALAPQGQLVTIGALSRLPFTIPNGPLIFNELRLAGFWISRWYERTPADRLRLMIGELAELVRSGRLHLPVAAQYALSDIAPALAAASATGRQGKVLLDCA